MKLFSLTIFAMFIGMVGDAQPPTWSRSNAASVPQASGLGAALALHKFWNTKTIPLDLIELKGYEHHRAD